MMARCGGKARKAVFKQLFGRIEIIGAFEQKVTVSMTLTNKTSNASPTYRANRPPSANAPMRPANVPTSTPIPCASLTPASMS